MNNRFNYLKTLNEKGLIDDQKFAQQSLQLYDQDSASFHMDQVDELEKVAKRFDVPFKRNLEDDENAIVSAINQFVSGTIEGFTTFGYADDPKTETEALLNKMGHLVGFAPDIIAGVLSFGTAPLAKRGALKGINLVRAQAAQSVEKGLGNIGAKYIPQLTKKVTEKVGKEEITKFQLRSVPMRVADFFVDNAEAAIGKSEFIKNSFIAQKMPDSMIDMVKQGAHLGAAMAISSRKAAVAGDWEAVREATLHGAYAGAAFGGIANYLKIGDLFASGNAALQATGYKKVNDVAIKLVEAMKQGRGLTPGQAELTNMVTRGIAGSAFTGIPMTVQEAPTADQVYEYLLGFFFGASGRPRYEVEVNKALQAEGHKIWKPVITELKKDGTIEKQNVPMGQVEQLSAWKDFSPAAKRYAKQREAEIFENTQNTTYQEGSEFSNLVIEITRAKLEKMPEAERKEILEGRNRNQLLAEANKEAAEKMQQKYETELADTVARKERLDDIDTTTLKVGETIDIFTNTGQVETVGVHKVFKNGNVRIINQEGQIHTINKGRYITENLYKPDYKIPAEVSKELAGREIDSLNKKEMETLNENLKKHLEKVVKDSERIGEIEKEDFIIDSKGKKLTRKDITDSIKKFEKQLKLSDTPANREKINVLKQQLDIYDSKSLKGKLVFRHIHTRKKTSELDFDVSKDSKAQRENSRELIRQEYDALRGKNDQAGIEYRKQQLKELDAKSKGTEVTQDAVFDALSMNKKVGTAARIQSIKTNDIPADTYTAAQKIAKDPNQMGLEFDREIDIEAEIIVPGNDPVYDIVAKLNDKQGTDWKTLDQTYQLKKAAQTANNQSEFNSFAKTFYKNQFSENQLAEIYFNASGTTKQNTHMFVVNQIDKNITATNKKTGKPIKLNVTDFVKEIKDTPKEGSNGESLDIHSTGTFHNRLKKDSNFEVILHLKNDIMDGTVERTNSLQQAVGVRSLEQLSAHLQEQYGKFIYYQHSSNHSFVTRPLVELTFEKKLLDRFMNDGGGQLYGGPGKALEHVYASTSSMKSVNGKRTDKLLMIDGIKENIPVYESPYHKTPELYYKEKISRTTYLLQDAGMLPADLSKVTYKQWTDAFSRHHGYFKGGKQLNSNMLYKNVIDFVKYSKTFHGGRTVDRELVNDYLQGRKLKLIVIKDNFSSKGEMTTDGAMHWVGGWRNALQKARGKKNDENYVKAIIQKPADFANDRGLTIFKQAERHASKELEQYALDKGYDGIVYESSAKTNSRHQIGELVYNEKTGKFTEKVKPEVIEIEPEHIRIITSEIEVPNRDAIQMHLGAADIRNALSSPKFIAAHRKMIADSISGSKSYMKKYKDAIKKNGYDFDTINGKKVRINDLDLSEVIDVLNNHVDSKLGRSILKSIYGEKEYLNIGERGNKEIHSDLKALDSINELLSQVNYEALALIMHGNKRYIEQSITNYARNRLTNLRVPSGFSYPRLQSQDAALWKKLRNMGLANDTFMLNDGHKTDKIKVFGQLRKVFGGKEVELQKILTEFNNTKDSKTRDLLQAVMENFVMNRSPVGNREGVLNLTFAGFSGQPGKGVHVTPRNMERLGGADTDGDAVAVYHGLDKNFASAFKPKKVDPNVKPIDKTDVNAFSEWGYKRNLSASNVADMTNPSKVLRQGANNYTAASNIGTSTNFNKHINDLFTFIKDSNGQFPINKSKDIVIRLADAKVTEPGTGKKLTLKTLEEHLNFFDKYESDISLNLDLDGSKNSVNPPVQYKFDNMLTRHFELFDISTNRKVNWPRYDGGFFSGLVHWSKFKNGTGKLYDTLSVNGKPEKNVGVRLKEQLLTSTITGKVNGINKVLTESQNKEQFIKERLKNTSQLTFEEYVRARGDADFILGPKQKEPALEQRRLDLLEEMKKRHEQMQKGQVKKYNDYFDSVATGIAGIQRITNNRIIEDYNPKTKEFTVSSEDPINKITTMETFTINDLIKSLKNNSTQSIQKDLSGNLKSMYDFNRALTKGYGTTGKKVMYNELGKAASNFFESFSRDREGSEVFNNHMLDIAKVIAEPFESTGYDGVSVDIRVIPESQYKTTIINLGKAHAKVKKTHFYNHLKKQGLLSNDLLLNELYFDKIAGADKDVSKMSVKELKTLWDKMASEVNTKTNEGFKVNLGNQEGHVLQQLVSVAALNNLAVRYNELRTQLFNTGIETKLIDAKINEMLTFSYDFKLNDYLAARGFIKRMDGDQVITNYRKNALEFIGSTKLKPEQQELLSNVLSKTLLSDILPRPENRNREEYLKSVKEEFIKINKFKASTEKGAKELNEKINDIEKLEQRYSLQNLKSNLLNLQKYAKNNIEAAKKEFDKNNTAELYSKINTFNMYTTGQGFYRQGLFRRESIPLQHKRELMQEIRDIFDAGTTVNQESVQVKIELPKVRRNTTLKNAIEPPQPKRDTRKTSEVTELVTATLDGRIVKSSEKKDVNQQSILFEKTELEDMIKILRETESQAGFKELAERSILSKLANKTPKEQANYMQNPQDFVDVLDFKKSPFKKGDVALITPFQKELLKTWEKLIDKNPKLLIDLEGNVAEFMSAIGVEGKARLGVEFGQITPLEFEAFTRMVKDIYTDTDSRLTSKIKLFEKIQGVDATDRVAVEKARKKSPFNSWVHYAFYNSIGLYQLQKREMLSYQKDNVPIYDRVSGKTNLKSVITPTNTIELNVDVIDHGKRLAASIQDFNEKRKSAIYDFKNSGDKNVIKFDLELDTIATEYREAGYPDTNVKYDRFSTEYFDRSFERAQAELKEIEIVTNNKLVIKDSKKPGDLKTVTVREYITELNKANDTYLEWFKEFNERGMEQKGKSWRLKQDVIDRITHSSGFISDGKIFKRFREVLDKSRTIDSTAANMVGFNELNYILHQYAIREMVNKKTGLNIQDLIESKKEIPNSAKAYLNKFQRENPFQPINKIVNSKGEVSNYWPHIGNGNVRGNSKNTENHVQYLAAEHIKEIKQRGFKAFMPDTKVEWLATPENKRNLGEFQKKSLQEFITDKTHMQSVKSYTDTGMSERLVMFNNKTFPAAFTNSSYKNRSEHVLLGYEKTGKALDQYTSQFVKAYTDTFSSIRGTMYIDRFIRKNAMNDIEHTNTWGSYMRRSLNTKLGIDSFVDLNIDGFRKSEYKLLQEYIKADLKENNLTKNLNRKLSYLEKEFIRKVNDNINVNVNDAIKSGLEGPELIKAMDKARMREAKNLAKEENINKIKRYGTAFHVFSDEAAVNFVRRIEEKFGEAMGMKEGEFAFFKDLGSKTDPITGEKVVMNEAQRRMATAQKLNAFSTFEGRYELMSLLFHPKTMIANYFGGGTNIYADVGGDIFRKSLSEDYVLEIFGNATYEVIDPITRQVRLEKVRNMKDVERIFVQRGLLEGMYLEEVGLTSTLQKGQPKRFAEALAKRFGKWEKENPILSENPVESEKALKLTINELQKRYNVGESIVQIGAKPMQYSERMLRRTAAIAHYINARQTVQPLIDQGKMSWDSPYLIEMARKGIEASQYIYHSAFRSNYSNTSLGRVMTRFHPYAWNSIKRRRNLYKQASYTKWMMNTDAQQRFNRQTTADLMSMALASIFVGTMFEYALSPPMSWMQDTAQWLFGDKEDRKRAFFSAWPHTSLAPLQVVTPPISRFVLAPVSSLLNGEWDNFVKYQAATWVPGGRLMRDAYRSYKSPSMSFDFLTGIPLHRIGQEIGKSRDEVEKRLEQEMEASLGGNSELE